MWKPGAISMAGNADPRDFSRQKDSLDVENEFFWKQRSFYSCSGMTMNLFKTSTKKFAKIGAMSYSITREMAPIYTMVDNKEELERQSRAKRGIAGTLILTEAYWPEPAKIFDHIQLLAANEYGAMCEMTLNEVEILDYDGLITPQMPVNQLVNEQWVYVARNVTPWRWIKKLS